MSRVKSTKTEFFSLCFVFMSSGKTLNRGNLPCSNEPLAARSCACTARLRLQRQELPASWGLLGLIFGAIGGLTGVVWGAFGMLAGALYGLFVGTVLAARQLKKLDGLCPRTARGRSCGRSATYHPRGHQSVGAARIPADGCSVQRHFKGHHLECLGEFRGFCGDSSRGSVPRPPKKRSS